MSSTHQPGSALARSRGTRVVMTLCWIFVLLDGVDLFVYGSVLPTLLDDRTLALTAGEAGQIGSCTTFGMLIGALGAGTVTDWIGRKKTIIATVTLFSLASVLCAEAQSAQVFGLARLLAGLGLGGLLPIAIAYAMEHAPPARRNLMVAVVMTAHQAGGMLAAGFGIWVVPSLGWRAVFWVCSLPVLVVVPLAVKYLPESVGFLMAKGRTAEAEATARRNGSALEELPDGNRQDRHGAWRSLHALFTGREWMTTLAFWLTSFAGLLLVYGVSTWLPTMMRESGYALGSSIGFLLVVNCGGIAGMLCAGPLSDRFGAMPVTVIWFVLTAAGTGLLAVHMPLAATYVVVFFTGAWLFSGQSMVYASVGGHHSAASRATAVGWVAGMGRFGAVFGPWLGGVLVASDASKWGFGVFALAGLFGAAMMALAALSTRRHSSHATVPATPAPR